MSSPFGTPENPMDDDMFSQKFDACAKSALSPKSQRELDELKNVIRALDTIDDISELTRLL